MGVLAVARRHGIGSVAMLLAGLFADHAARGCTTVVVSARVAAGGRSLLWKNRDAWQPQNEVVFDNTGTYAFVGVVNAEAVERVWMGTNTAGLGIENALSKDLTVASVNGPGNGSLIRRALQTCATVDDFERLLVETNGTGWRIRGNFGVIDAAGGAAIFEASSRSFQKFDANDRTVAPEGFLVRANFSFTALGGPTDDPDVISNIYSSRRYCRAKTLCEQQSHETPIDLPFLLQHVARDIDVLPTNIETASRPVDTTRTINRDSTVSAVVIEGVAHGEDPSLTTMWTLLGQPAFSVAVPCWAAQGGVANELNGAGRSPVCALSRSLRNRNYFSESPVLLTDHLPVIFKHIRTTEQAIVDQTVRSLERWRQQPPSRQDMWDTHQATAETALAGLQRISARLPTIVAAGDVEPQVATEFLFEDPDGTGLADTEDAVGDAAWTGGLTDCTVQNGRLRLRCDESAAANCYADITPNVNVTQDDGLRVKRGWIVIDVSGWNLQGKTSNEVVRIGFASRLEGDLQTAGLQLHRTAAGDVAVSGVAFGAGSEPIESNRRWPARQTHPVTFVIELDKVAGNAGEGEAGGRYRLYCQSADGTFDAIGPVGNLRRLRNGNFLNVHVGGCFQGADEYFDIDRIAFTTTSPLRE